LSDRARTRLEAAAPGLEVHWVPYQESANVRNARSSGNLTEAHLASAPVLSAQDWAILERTTAAVVLDLPSGVMERTPALQWVQVIAAGTEHIDVGGFAARGIPVTSGAGIAATPIAEFILGRLLQVWKHLRTFDEQQTERRWDPIFGRRVAGLTLGIVGLGSIGRATARRARAFDMTVLANRRSASPGESDPDVDELFTSAAIDEMIGRCDAVVVSAAATPETSGLFGRARINAMRPGSVLCNVARGSLVDEKALVAALQSGHLSAAILDVTAEEPTPGDSPLWSAPNCYLSPHSAVSLDGYQDALSDLAVRNFERFVRGQPLENLVQA
jgi:phosphoglycerate dehydrogenase-like enzyme